MNYYNEFDKKTAAWLRELIKAGLIPKGEVDERSITDVQSGDLRGFTQCHFFAGIGGWPYALRLAGWPEDQPVWTGSCPCQPFSRVGKRKAERDERHLWPTWLKLISKSSPAIVFGEQVESPLGRDWLSNVQLDLEALGFTFGAADLCAAGFTNHQRQRLFWVASNTGCERVPRLEPPGDSCKIRPWWARSQEDMRKLFASPFSDGPSWVKPLLCSGNDGVSDRLVGCHAAGNAIVPQVAAEFIRAAVEAINQTT